MLYNILTIGDVVGGCGVSCLEHHLRAVKKLKNIHFTVVNGENAAMVGLTPNDAERIFSAGADVITLGNHTFGKMQITDYLDDCPYILRPHNLGARVPGRGYGVFDCGRARIAVMNLIGRCDLAFHADNPFKTADEEVFPKGTGYLTDLGMTGAVRSVLGIKPEQSVETFLGGLPGRYREPEKSAGKMQGAIFTLDDATGLCVSVERVDVR